MKQDGWTAPRQNNFKLDDREPFTLPKRRFEYSKDVFRGFVFNNLKQFFYDFHNGHAISPMELLNSIRESYRKSRTVLPHWTQCDASEAFTLLTECLGTEERKIKKVAVKNHDFTHFKKIPVEDAIKVYQKIADQANVPTWIDAVFGLVYIQITTCRDPECKHVSTRLVSTMHLILHLNFKPQESNRVGYRKNSGSGSSMSKYKQKKLKEKKKKEIRRVRKNTGPSHSNGHVDSEESKEEMPDLFDNPFEDGKYEATAECGEDHTLTDPEHDDDVLAADSPSDCSASEGEEEEEDDEENKKQVTVTDLINGNGDDGLPLTFESTIAPYKKDSHAGITIMDCLAHWAAPNEFESYQCDGCCPEKSKKRVDAVQRYLIFAPPPVLALCLQRATMRHTKLSTHVKFDLVMDIAPFCVKYGLRIAKDQKELKYGLYGIVVHEGFSSNSGHYVAYVRRRKPPANIRARFEEAFSSASVQPETITNLMEETRKASEINGNVNEVPDEETDRWYYVSDNHYNEVSWSDVARRQAFMLFYERLD
uniref:USP domain-containing protein n=1 Tax=Steinernema glaseri TaxID=37863 RepID=A0A1I7ZDZ6_9BILA